jgi:hypothetical protein
MAWPVPPAADRRARSAVDVFKYLPLSSIAATR